MEQLFYTVSLILRIILVLFYFYFVCFSSVWYRRSHAPSTTTTLRCGRTTESPRTPQKCWPTLTMSTSNKSSSGSWSCLRDQSWCTAGVCACMRVYVGGWVWVCKLCGRGCLCGCVGVCGCVNYVVCGCLCGWVGGCVCMSVVCLYCV